MCGIAGILNRNGRPVDAEALRAITDALAHRGPDGEGVYLDGALGLGHRRLAILDLSASGSQPMSSSDGRYWIVFNGEIYNFLELRCELQSCGHVFKSESDTEVILAAYDRWGADCQLKFNGMWAYAIWDSRERTLFLSRDRFGIKPLFYLSEPDRFAFASEMKAFLRLNQFAARENPTALRRVLTDVFSLEATEECLLEGVKRLLPGHCLTVDSSGIKVWRWWNTLNHLAKPPKGLPEQAEQFRELFFDSCRLRLRSDVPVATCLSGGLDSSAVLCTLAEINRRCANQAAMDRRTQNWQHAFVATFPGTPLDERQFAEIAIRHAGAEPIYKPMLADAAVDELNRIVFDLDDIYLNLPAPAWTIYRELRRNDVVVSLDGHGGDELLGGYAHYAHTSLRASGGFLRAPARAWDVVNTLHDLNPPGGAAPSPSRAQLMFQHDPILSFPGRAARALYRRVIKPHVRSKQSWVRNPPARERTRSSAEEEAIEALGPLNARLYRDFHFTVLPTILRNFDRCSMAHGVEVRMPFMDWRLVCFGFSLAEESKIGGGFTKRVLREAMRGVMPETLRTRKSKLGFNSPLPTWLNGPLRHWVLDQVNDREFLQSDIWNGPLICDYVKQRQADGAWNWSEAERVWPFLHAHVWRRTFLKHDRKG